MVNLLLNGSKVKTFAAKSIQEIRKHSKNMSQWEERFYKVGENYYYINGRNKAPVRINRIAKGIGEFDDILPP